MDILNFDWIGQPLEALHTAMFSGMNTEWDATPDVSIEGLLIGRHATSLFTTNKHVVSSGAI
jgi:hypothetical protein